MDLREHFGAIDVYLFDQLHRGRISKGQRILDAGCGKGRNLHYLLREGFDVYGADEAFVTGTFGGLTPVTAVDGRAIGPYGLMTKKLQAHYDEAVHRAVDAARPSR